MKQKLHTISLLLLFFSISFVSKSQCANTPSFGSSAVMESFEVVTSASSPSTLGPQYTVPHIPYTFSSGVTLTTPDPNSERQGLFRADFQQGDASWGFCNSIVTATDVPDGTVYLALNSTNTELTFSLPVVASKVGLYVEGMDVCEGSGSNTTTITLIAYDIFNTVIGTCTTEATGIASNWKSHFLGFNSAGYGIAKFTITGPFIILDKLTFDPGCTTPQTWYLDADNDSYYTGSGVAACSSPGTGYKSTGLTGGGDCNDNDDEVTPLTVWYFDSDSDGFGDLNNTRQSCTQPQDYVANNTDNCTLVANPDQLDTDGDGIGDGCDTNGPCAIVPSFGSSAVMESFEVITSGSSPSTLGPQFTIPAIPYIFGSGVTLTTPDPNSERQGVFRADFQQGDASWGFCNSIVTATDVPDGTVYLALNSTNTELTFSLPVVASKVGLYVEGMDVCEGSGSNTTTITLIAYDIFNTVIGTCTTEATGIASNWKSHFLGFNSAGYGIAKFTITGPFIILDKLTFDPGCTTPQTWYLDADNDSYYTGSGVAACSSPGTGYKSTALTAGGDCNDNNATVNPGASELCDGFDNSCDGQIDEGFPLVNYYRDADGDGYGNPSQASTAKCSTPTGYVVNNTDCNDANANVHPGVTEICDGIDNNCEGRIDEGCLLVNMVISDVSMKEGNTGQKTMIFSVTLSQSSSKTINVNYATQNGTATTGSDFVAKSGILTFNSKIKKQNITVSINGDKLPETNETFNVSLSNAINATITDALGVGTILNDDRSTTLASSIVQRKNNQAVNRTVKISPNPAQSIIGVQLYGYAGTVTIHLLNVDGKVLKKERVSGSFVNHVQMNVADITNGIYFLAVIDEKGRQTEKVIVHR